MFDQAKSGVDMSVLSRRERRATLALPTAGSGKTAAGEDIDTVRSHSGPECPPRFALVTTIECCYHSMDHGVGELVFSAGICLEFCGKFFGPRKATSRYLST